MWLLLLEAGGALALFVFIVWWTMSGAKPNPAPRDDAQASGNSRPPQQ